MLISLTSGNFDMLQSLNGENFVMLQSQRLKGRNFGMLQSLNVETLTCSTVLNVETLVVTDS